MGTEVTGGTLKLSVNSIEQEIKGISWDRNVNLLDATTTSSANGSSESVPGRAKTTLKIDADLFDGSSVKVTGANMSVTLGGNPFKVTNAEYTKTYTELDATTTATDPTGTASTAGRYKATVKFDTLMYRETADKITASAPTAQTCLITFKTGVSVTGQAILNQESISDEVNGICKVSYSGEYTGEVTETGLGALTMATEQPFVITFEDGTTTDKAITGNLIVLQKTVTSDTNGDAKVSYSATINGAITKAIYS